LKFGDAKLAINEYLGADYYVTFHGGLIMVVRTVRYGISYRIPRHVPVPSKRYVATVLSKLASLP